MITFVNQLLIHFLNIVFNHLVALAQLLISETFNFLSSLWEN